MLALRDRRICQGKTGREFFAASHPQSRKYKPVEAGDIFPKPSKYGPPRFLRVSAHCSPKASGSQKVRREDFQGERSSGMRTLPTSIECPTPALRLGQVAFAPSVGLRPHLTVLFSRRKKYRREPEKSK